MYKWKICETLEDAKKVMYVVKLMLWMFEVEKRNGINHVREWYT